MLGCQRDSGHAHGTEKYDIASRRKLNYMKSRGNFCISNGQLLSQCRWTKICCCYVCRRHKEAALIESGISFCQVSKFRGDFCCRVTQEAFPAATAATEAMFGQHALGSSAAPGVPPVVKCARRSAPTRPLIARSATRCQASRPVLPQEISSSGSSASPATRTPKHASRTSNRNVAAKASPAFGVTMGSPDSPKPSLTPVLVAVAFASLGALLFGLHVAIVNGLQDAVSSELGFSANTGLRGAVSLSAAAAPSAREPALMV